MSRFSRVYNEIRTKGFDSLTEGINEVVAVNRVVPANES